MLLNVAFSELKMKKGKVVLTNRGSINWVGAYKRKHNINDVATSKEPLSEQEELKRLRKENARLKMECEILKKATAYFAKETL